MESPPKEIESFFAKYKKYNYKKGSTIIYPHDKIENVFYLKSGFVREYTVAPKGMELTLHIFVQGSFFPMTSIISDINNRYYFDSLTDVELFQAPKADILNFLKKYPDVLFDLTGRLLKGLDNLLIRIESLAFDKANERVTGAILFLVRHFGTRVGENVTIEHKFTHDDIAKFAGVTRETVTRELSVLSEKGLVNYAQHQISVPNLSELKNSFS